MASSAFAVADPDPDGIGIWFDMTADTNFMEVPANSMVPTYLIISNASVPSIAGWECEIFWDTAAAMVLGSWTYNGSALNIYGPPQFAVGLAEPIMTGPATLLVSFTLFVLNPAGTLFTVGPAPDPSTPDNVPLYVDGDDFNHLVLLQNATGYGAGGEILPCAGINQLPPAAVENATWSHVKSLW
jgi:hypothetical protein